MARKKDTVALFEVLSKTKQREEQGTLEVPGWMDKEAVPASEGGIENRPGLDIPAPTPRSAPSSAPAAEGAVSTAGGRLHLSLNYISATVAIAAFVVLLVAAFMLGRKTTPTEPAAISGMDVELKKDLLDKNAGRTGTAGQTPQRQPGKFYLV